MQRKVEASGHRIVLASLTLEMLPNSEQLGHVWVVIPGGYLFDIGLLFQSDEPKIRCSLLSAWAPWRGAQSWMTDERPFKAFWSSAWAQVWQVDLWFPQGPEWGSWEAGTDTVTWQASKVTQLLLPSFLSEPKQRRAQVKNRSALMVSILDLWANGTPMLKTYPRNKSMGSQDLPQENMVASIWKEILMAFVYLFYFIFFYPIE